MEALFTLPLLGALVVALTRVDDGLFSFLTSEDSLLEWLQFAAFATASLFGLLLARALLRAGRLLPAAAYLLFAFGCFFSGGEEIAWGQRLLGLETPEDLARINDQGEITAHNISTALTVFNTLMLVVGLYGAVAWAMRTRAGRHVRTFDLFVPPFFLAPAFFVLFAYRLIRFTVLPEPVHTVVVLGEWPEFCLAFALAAFALLGWRRARLPSGAPLAQASSARA